MFKLIIFGIFLCITAVACYQVIPVLPSPVIGASASTFWDCRTKSVYYGDYFGNGTKPVLYRYDYVFNRHFAASIIGYSGGVSNLIPMNCAPNQYVAVLGLCTVVIHWDGHSGTARKLRDVFCVDEEFTDHVVTYAKADPKRRLYEGTAQVSYCNVMTAPQSSLYRYDKLRGVVKNFGEIRASSAMDWNIRTNQFYHKDVCQPNIMEYQWAPLTGELTNGHQVFEFTDPSMVANGMVIDKFGMLYVTLFGASSILKIDPRTSTILETYTIPAKFPTSLTFVGPQLDTLCVSTGNVAVDTLTGSVADTPITADDGKLYMIKDIFTRGHCDRKVCI